VLRKAGLPANLFDDPDGLISFRDRAHLFRVCMDATACNHFGFLVGQRQGLSCLGLESYIVRHAPDVQTALATLLKRKKQPRSRRPRQPVVLGSAVKSAAGILRNIERNNYLTKTSKVANLE
jgi:hypothetical protein